MLGIHTEDASLSSEVTGKQFIISGYSSELAQASFSPFLDKNKIYGTYNTNNSIKAAQNQSLFEVNLDSEKNIFEFVNKIRHKLSNIVLINFAAHKQDELLLNSDSTSWDKTFNVNVKSNFLLAKALIPIMMANKWGRIIHISSAKGVRGSKGSAIYSASKTAIEGLNKSIAKEYARFGITSNIISLGYFNYGLFKKLDSKKQEEFRNTLPSKLLGSANDISNCVHFLINSPFTNGSNILIDGCMD